MNILVLLRKLKNKFLVKNNKREKKTNEQIFSEIYSTKRWGRLLAKKTPFCSGEGSHQKEFVESFTKSVVEVLQSIDGPKQVVDLGCGDFNIGSQLIEYTDKYIGCDVVPELIKFNQENYSSNNVTFIKVDITSDELPDGDIVIIRQVLQHLPNRDILEVLKKVHVKYKHFILTEHNPSGKNFLPNIDIPTGGGTRMTACNSGLVIEEPPFSFQFKERKVLSEVPCYGGILSTIYYRIS